MHCSYYRCGSLILHRLSRLSLNCKPWKLWSSTTKGSMTKQTMHLLGMHGIEDSMTNQTLLSAWERMHKSAMKLQFVHEFTSPSLIHSET